MSNMLVALAIFILSAMRGNTAQQCGTFDAGTKVVGGEDTGGTRYPWFAVLRAKIPGKPPVCGGTLITPKHVLTAAHCFGVLEGRPNKDKFTVDLNTYDRCKDDEDGRESHNVVDVHVHENYGDVESFNDIAIIILNGESSLPPACVPNPSNGSPSNEDALVIGFGYVMEGGPDQPCHLMRASIQKYSQKMCLTTNLPKDICENDTTFTGGADNTDTCQGDSGGPCLTYTKDGRLIVAGIVSFGFGCARKDLPGVYTNVASYIDWIQQRTGGMLQQENAKLANNSPSRTPFTPKSTQIPHPQLGRNMPIAPSDGRVIFPLN